MNPQSPATTVGALTGDVSAGIDHGDAAFPTANGQFFGMSLRDYFAAAAVMKLSTDWQPESAAKLAYQLADAMLKARAA